MLENSDIVSDLLKAGEIFQIGNMYFPIYKRSEKSGKLLNIKKDREAHIEQADKFPTTKNFISYFNEYIASVPPEKQHLLSIIREFPFIIHDQSLWNSLYTPDPDSKDPTTKNYFMGDIFLPNLSCLIELQSSYHRGHEKYDKAREDYIYQKYGVSVIQLNGFGGDPDMYSWRRTQKKEMYRLISELGPKLDSYRPVMSNLDEIAELWKKEHQRIIQLYELIRELLRTGESRITVYVDDPDLVYGMRWRYGEGWYLRELVFKVFENISSLEILIHE